MTPVCAFREDPELSRYLFGEMDQDEKRRVEMHLASCADCRQELAAFERTVKLVRTSEGGGGRLEARARESVLAAARSAVTGRPARRLTLRPFLLSSAAALVVVAATWLLVEDARHRTAVPAARLDRSGDSQLMAAREAAGARGDSPAAGEPAPRDQDLDEARRKMSQLGYLGGKPQAKHPELSTEQAVGADVLSLAPPPSDAGLIDQRLRDLVDGEKQTVAATDLAEPAEEAPPQTEAAQKDASQKSEGTSSAIDRAESTHAPVASPPPAAAGAGGALASRSGSRSEAAPSSRAQTFAPELKKNAAPADKESGTAGGGEKLGLQAPGAALPALSSAGRLGEDPSQRGAALSAKLAATTAAHDEGVAKDRDGATKRKSDDSYGEAANEIESDSVTDDDRKEAVGRQIDRLFAELGRQPGETPSMMLFRYWGDHAFVEASETAQSTFGVDVDTASYTLARAYLTQGDVPPHEAVRTEEFVNYFKSKLPPPEQGTFRIQAELAPTPFAEADDLLLKIGVKAREVARSERRPCALTFVVDVSGSMNNGNRLTLVKDSLKLLVGALGEHDRIGLVVFSSHATKVLDPVSVAQRERIVAAIDGLHAEGSTNVDSGLTMGYEMASGACIAKGNNRVILCSDGVANTGTTDQAQILGNVARYRAQGILLNCVGVGMGNHNDALLEQLADQGDGQCVYVDRLEEARRTFLDNLEATLETVARDVKIQVEFDPTRVLRYRQLGYENRALRNQDFRNDAVDAGEVGAGHEVVALYEIKLRPNAAGPLLDIRVRAKDADVPAEVSEIHRTVDASEIKASFEVANPRFQMSAVVAEFAELLRESYWTHGRTLAGLFPLAERVARALPDDQDVLEMCALIRAAAERKRAQPDELARAIDLVKRNNYVRSQLETQTSEASRNELSKLNAQSEELRRTVEALLEKR